MTAREIKDELVAQIVQDLRTRYGLDDDDVRGVGERLATIGPAARSVENAAFVERFVAEHRGTFDRLAQ